MTRYCIFSTGSREEGEDISAEVFSRLLGTGRRIEEAKLEAWLFTVARNLCVSHHRAVKRRGAMLQRSLSDPPAVLADAWRMPDVWEHVRRLDERSRLAVYLRVVEDRPFAEVAGLMGVSLSAVKMTYYRALSRVRASMAPEAVPGVSATGGVSDVE